MATLIEDLRIQVARLKAQGHSAVSLDEFERYLVSRSENAAAAASAPSEWERFRHVSSLVHKSALQTMQATLDAGLAALKAAILINGGGAVAVLAFLGNVLAKEAKTVNVSVPGMRWTLQIFVYGVFCAVVALAWRYFSSFSDGMIIGRQTAIENARDALNEELRTKAERSIKRWGTFWIVCTVCAILFGVGSIAAFVWGGLQAARSVW